MLDRPIDVSDRDYIKKSISEPWKAHLGRPIEGRLSHAWVLPLSMGLTDKQGNYVGSVVVALDAESLSNELARTMKDSGVHFAITNLSLTLLTQTKASQDFFKDNFDVDRLVAMDFEAKPSGQYSHASLLDSSRIYSYYERSSQYPYLLFLGIDAEKSRAEIRKMLWPRIFQLSVIAAFLLFVLWTVRKRIIHPVISLSTQTAAIVRGDRFDAEQTRGPLEIEQLAYEIKRLYDYIEERRRVEAELRLKNAELTRIKDAAQVTNQVKADFFAYVGQELSEPAELIVEQSETLKDQHFGPLPNPKYLASASSVHAQARQLMAMLEDIKSIAKAEPGLLTLNESDVDLAFVLQKAVRIFRERQPGIDVQFDIGTLPHVRGDELRLKQLILTVLGALAQQVAGAEPIRVSSSLRAQELSLSFSYAGNTSRSRQGMALALARLLIALHQGVLESKTVQERVTVITLKFPSIRVL